LCNLARQALRADPLGGVGATAAHAEAAREDLVADPLGNRMRLARQLRFVHLHPPVADHAAVDHDLVARADRQQIADDQLLGRQRICLTIADDGGGGPGQQRDLVERALGADLLHHADQDVERDHAGRYQRVERAAEQGQRDAETEQAAVDERENILDQDLPVGPATRRRGGITLSAGAAVEHLALRQAAEWRGGLVDCGHVGRRLQLIRFHLAHWQQLKHCSVPSKCDTEGAPEKLTTKVQRTLRIWKPSWPLWLCGATSTCQVSLEYYTPDGSCTATVPRRCRSR
jgi:hypothetical protein